MQQVCQIGVLHHLLDLGLDLGSLCITDPTERRPKVTLIAKPFLVDVSCNGSNLPCSASQSLFSVSGKPAKKVSQHFINGSLMRMHNAHNPRIIC